MAQVLSVIARHGVHGAEYNYVADSICEGAQSRVARTEWGWRKKISTEEFENYLILAWRWGFVERSKYQEVEWVSGVNKSSYSHDDEIVRLTQKGWDLVDLHGRTVIVRWLANLRDNVPTILVSVLTAWALYYLGAPDRNVFNGGVEYSPPADAR